MSDRNKRYLDYLASANWQELRGRKLMERDSCLHCQSKQRLHVHHINYKNLTDCELSDLTVLCNEHHDVVHWALKLKGAESCDYPEGMIPGLIIWYLNLPEGERRLKGKQERARVKSEKRSGIKKRKKRIRLAFRRVSSAEYREDAIRELVVFLQGELNGWNPPVPNPKQNPPNPPRPPRPERPVLELTLANLKAMKGFTRKQLEHWGITYPPKSGWRKKLITKLEPICGS